LWLTVFIEQKIYMKLERDTYADAMADKENPDGAAPLAKRKPIVSKKVSNLSNGRHQSSRQRRKKFG
jgi:hypothetical protein